MNASLPTATRQLDLAFVRRGARTAFERRLFSWPYVLARTFALDAARPHRQTVIVQSSAGPISGSDHLRQRLALAPGTAVHLTTQGATAVHRAAHGLTSRETVEIALEGDASLDYLPQPRILFPDAALDQLVEIDCAAASTLLYADAFTLHDPAGQGGLFRRYRSELRLRRDGELILDDRFDITGLPRHFARHRAFGTLLLVTSGNLERFNQWSLDLSESLAGIEGLYAAASPLPGSAGIGLRFAGRDLRQLRAGTELATAALQRLLAPA